MKFNLPVLDNTFFIQHGACYDPSTKLGENWQGTAKDILIHSDVPACDKIWAISRKGALPENLQRLIAVAFVKETPLGDGRKVFDLITDERIKKAPEVAEKFATGKATLEELAAASAGAAAGAWAADWVAVSAAVSAAVRSAASAGASAAASAAASASAAAAAWAAAGDAAWAAASSLASHVPPCTACAPATPRPTIPPGLNAAFLTLDAK